MDEFDIYSQELEKKSISIATQFDENFGDNAITVIDETPLKNSIEEFNKKVFKSKFREIFNEYIRSREKFVLGKISEYIDLKKISEHKNKILRGMLNGGTMPSKKHYEKRNGPGANANTELSDLASENILEKIATVNEFIENFEIESKKYIDKWEMYNKMFGENGSYAHKNKYVFDEDIGLLMKNEKVSEVARFLIPLEADSYAKFMSLCSSNTHPKTSEDEEKFGIIAISQVVPYAIFNAWGIMEVGVKNIIGLSQTSIDNKFEENTPLFEKEHTPLPDEKRFIYKSGKNKISHIVVHFEDSAKYDTEKYGDFKELISKIHTKLFFETNYYRKENFSKAAKKEYSYIKDTEFGFFTKLFNPDKTIAIIESRRDDQGAYGSIDVKADIKYYLRDVTTE
ncbi:MAG: hypothetical protein ACP5NV_06800, partial [Candidatus Woesearchaeota archaeon]